MKMGRGMAAEILERRYRRLLALYPASYRASHAEEMLGVALARCAPGQRRPDPGEAASLIVSGIRKHLGGIRSGYRDQAWRDAARVLAVAGPVVLASSSARDVIGGVSGWGIMPPFSQPPSWPGLASAAGWALVAGAAISGGHWGRGWRVAAAAGAGLGAAGQAIVLARAYSGNPSELVTSWWKLVFTVVIALSALIATGSEGRPLSWRPITAITIAGAAFAAYPALEAATTTTTPLPGGVSVVSSPLFGISGDLNYALLAVAAIVALVAFARLEPAVRRRVAIMLLPVTATLALVAWTFGGFLEASPRFQHPVTLTAPQWAALALVPVAGFGAGLIWLRRHERWLRSLSARTLSPP